VGRRRPTLNWILLTRENHRIPHVPQFAAARGDDLPPGATKVASGGRFDEEGATASPAKMESGKTIHGERLLFVQQSGRQATTDLLDIEATGVQAGKAARPT